MDERSPVIRSVAVYCASSNAVPERFMALAAETGAELARRGKRLVYGGGSIGMMGRVADAVLARGGEALGVITRQLLGLEVAHPGLTELRIVETMHERKQVMTSEADAFFILPGGFGTLDEAIEAITWKQLRIHTKPIVFVNGGGYFDALLAFFDHAVAEQFVHPRNLDLFEVAPDVPTAFEALARARMPAPESNPLWRAPRP